MPKGKNNKLSSKSLKKLPFKSIESNITKPKQLQKSGGKKQKGGVGKNGEFESQLEILRERKTPHRAGGGKAIVLAAPTFNAPRVAEAPHSIDLLIGESDRVEEAPISGSNCKMGKWGKSGGGDGRNRFSAFEDDGMDGQLHALVPAFALKPSVLSVISASCKITPGNFDDDDDL